MLNAWRRFKRRMLYVANHSYDPQHWGFSSVPGQSPSRILADIVYDPFSSQEQAEAGGFLLNALVTHGCRDEERECDANRNHDPQLENEYSKRAFLLWID